MNVLLFFLICIVVGSAKEICAGSKEKIKVLSSIITIVTCSTCMKTLNLQTPRDSVQWMDWVFWDSVPKNLNFSKSVPHNEMKAFHSTLHIPMILVLLQTFYSIYRQNAPEYFCFSYFFFFKGLCIPLFSIFSGEKSDLSPATGPLLGLPTINLAFVTKPLSSKTDSINHYCSLCRCPFIKERLFSL